MVPRVLVLVLLNPRRPHELETRLARRRMPKLYVNSKPEDIRAGFVVWTIRRRFEESPVSSAAVWSV